MDYNIPFKGLKDGKHQYEYHIDAAFFEKFPDSEITQGDLMVNVDLLKRPTGIETEFQIKGVVTVACDRCLDDMDCSINYTGKLFFEFGSETAEVSDELIVLSEGENYLELDQYIYEFIYLSLPLQKFHPTDKKGKTLCNAEMLAKLKTMIVNSENDEIDNDPRWDKLKDLIN